MKKSQIDLEAVTITAGTFEASDKKQGTVLSSLDVVTTASSQGDVTGALKTLPGTQQVGESEGLFVRGGTATETKIFVDGNLVNNFFYATKPGIASRGRFNPFLFKGTQFSAGGYSALYGQALSSALILETADIAERSEGSLNVSVIGLGGGIQRLAKDKKSSWGATYNYANLRPAFQIIKQRQEFIDYPIFHDGDLNFRIKTKGGMIKYYGYGSYNNMGLRENDIDSAVLKNHFNLRNINTYQNISWRENLGNAWKSVLTVSYSTNNDRISNDLEDVQGNKKDFEEPQGYDDKNFQLSNPGNYAQGRLVFEKKLAGLSALRFGGEYLYAKERFTLTDKDDNSYKFSYTDNVAAGFGEWDFYISNKLAAKSGLRMEYAGILNKWNLAPRFSLAYKLNKVSQGSFAYGIFYQNPEKRTLPILDQGVGFSQASHYILQYQRSANRRLLRAEVFYKNYGHLYKTGFSNLGRPGVTGNFGDGYATGLELFWRDRTSIDFLDYWVSYSYLDTKRDFLNYPGSMVPDFAAKHTASFVAKTFMLPLKTGFNLSYTYSSGRPYYQMLYDNTSGKTTIGDRGKTKDFSNLSVSVNYLPFLGQKSGKAFSVLVLMVNNVLGFKNVFSYDYGTITGNKRAVLPTSDRFVFLGWFMTFGVDRTDDIINNNL